MDPNAFSERSPGRLVKNLDGYWTFVPDPLPHEVEIDQELFTLVNLAERALGRLVGKAEALPDPRVAVRSFVRREAELSSRIENTFADFRELVLFESAPEEEAAVEERTPDVREVVNNERALAHGLQAVQEHGREVSVALMKEMHRLLLEGVQDETLNPGQFRLGQVLIGRSRSIEEARFVPPPALEVPRLMDDLAAFISAPSDLPPVVRSGLIHYQFEAIHPFLDGNGRIGRALILLLLCAEKVLPLPVFNPSHHLEQHRDEYYAGLLAVSTTGDWLGWSKFYARAVTAAATDAVALIDRLKQLQGEYHERVRAAGGSVHLLRLVDELFATPAITIPGAADVLGLTYRAAQNNVQKLVAAGILREVTGRQRGRIYLAEGVARAVSGEAPTQRNR